MQSLYQRQVEGILGALGVAPPGKLTVMKGETVRMTVAFNYRGTGISVTLRCSIGKRTLGVFDEHAYKTKTITLPQSAGFLPYEAFADIPTTAISPESNYDIEAKITEYASATLVKIDNVIDVLGAPEFQDFRITDYSKV